MEIIPFVRYCFERFRYGFLLASSGRVYVLMRSVVRNSSLLEQYDLDEDGENDLYDWCDDSCGMVVDSACKLVVNVVFHPRLGFRLCRWSRG